MENVKELDNNLAGQSTEIQKLDKKNNKSDDKKNTSEPWSLFDIVWFAAQLIILLILNVVLLALDGITVVTIMSLVASMTGGVCTWLIVKKDNTNYYYGIANVILYGIIAFVSTVYGDFILNIFIFLPLNVWGFIEWSKRTNEAESDGVIESRRLSVMWLIILTVALAVCVAISGSLLLFFTNDVAPFLDSTSTWLSIFAMVLMIFYFREQYWIWIVVNVVSVLMWVQVLFTGDATALVFIGMFGIYTINAVIGIIRWN